MSCEEHFVMRKDGAIVAKAEQHRFTVADDLERRATQLVEESYVKGRRELITDGLVKELALVMHHVQQLRDRHITLRESLLEQELTLRDAKHNLHLWLPLYTAEWFAQAQSLYQQITAIEQQRRDLLVNYGRDRQLLDDRMLVLLVRHEQLTPP